MVYSGLYPWTDRTTRNLRDALDNSSSTTPPDVPGAGDVGGARFGFRCGFLGLLHMESP